ncbi:hypothetical protein BC940DRAFT_295706 [Gongronella butleri]|nr:hypothetical protein BC940DRAFT_295706 [Gongronella butleri]
MFRRGVSCTLSRPLYRRRWVHGSCVARKRAPSLIVAPRFNYNMLHEQIDDFAANMRSRRYDPVDVSAYGSLCVRRKALYQELTELRAQQNKLSKEMAVFRKKKDLAAKDAQQELIHAAQEAKRKIGACEQSLVEVEEELMALTLVLPNTIHADVPAEEPVVVHEVFGAGVPLPDADPSFHVDHVALNDRLHFMDMQQASRVSGASFYYLEGMGALLELALIQYAMDAAVRHGFHAVTTPDLVRSSVAYACGFQPRRGESEQIYRIQQQLDEGDDNELCLAGTAEIPLAGKCLQQVLPESSLPRRFVGFGHAFRREAGGRGQETRGLYRVHQFSKVELFAVTAPEQSDAVLADLLVLQKDIFSGLGLTYRVLDMPCHELGASAHRKYDMEAWLPGRRTWGEISSTSNCTDYQSRRLDIRFRPTHPEKHKENTLFCHTLNGTAMAVPRVLIAILESFQEPNGSVRIPKVLQPWLPGRPTHLNPMA